MSPSSGRSTPATPEVDPRGGRRPDGGDNGHPANGHAGNGHAGNGHLSDGRASPPEPAPVRAGGVELLGATQGSGYRRPPSLVRRGDGQAIQLTPVLYRVLHAIDGRRGYDDIARHVSPRIGRHVAPEDIRYLVERKLRPLGLLRAPDGSEPVVRRMNPLLALHLRKVISKPDVTRRISAPFAGLFLPPIVIPVLLTFVAVSGWVLFDRGLASAAHEALYEPGRLLLVVALMMLSAGFHEFGHAAAAMYRGATPGAMGVGVYLVWPVFYTDVTDAYRLDRRARLTVDAGGLYFNAIFAVAIVGIWAVTRWESLLLLVPIQLVHMLHQLLPFVRFDGYHILADLTGVPDLFAHIAPTLRRLVPGRRTPPSPLRAGAGAVVTLWVLTVIPILGLALRAMIQVFPRLAATVWDSLGTRWELLERSWSGGSLSEAAVVVVSMVALALPVLGIGYLLARVLRRTTSRVWRGTADRPALRTLAVVTGLAGLVLLAWAWWPNGQYRPIEAGERWTLLDPGRATGGPVLVWPQAAEQPAPVATPRLALVLTPREVPGTEPVPEQIIVLPPRPGVPPHPAGVPERDGWVFPFDPPAPPGEGDNQALAVNTLDGSTLYDVSFAVVWITDEQLVDNVNEAWAVASCSFCQTVAVSFQAVFISGDADVVVPQNAAVAVNYDCVACHTTAIAVQVVATIDGPLSSEAVQELLVIWSQLEALEEQIAAGMPPAQIYEELVQIQDAIVQVLVEHGAIQLTDDTALESSSSDDPVPAAETTTTRPDPVADDTTTVGPTPTEPAPSPSPSPTPSETPSESPSPAPAESPSPVESPLPSPSPSP